MFTESYKNNDKELEEFKEKVEYIATIAQDKFIHEIEDRTYDSIEKFSSIIAREVDSIVAKIHLQNVNLLKSSLISYAINSNFISGKGETSLIRSLLNIIEHTIRQK